VYFVQEAGLTSYVAYRDKKVVPVSLCVFRAPLHAGTAAE
jgi:hypothetical protein